MLKEDIGGTEVEASTNRHKPQSALFRERRSAKRPRCSAGLQKRQEDGPKEGHVAHGRPEAQHVDVTLGQGDRGHLLGDIIPTAKQNHDDQQQT